MNGTGVDINDVSLELREAEYWYVVLVELLKNRPPGTWEREREREREERERERERG